MDITVRVPTTMKLEDAVEQAITFIENNDGGKAILLLKSIQEAATLETMKEDRLKDSLPGKIQVAHE